MNANYIAGRLENQYPLLFRGQNNRVAHECFFFIDPATTEIYTLSLHDALPISFGLMWHSEQSKVLPSGPPPRWCACEPLLDRKSTRLNSSHDQISYAVFCL